MSNTNILQNNCVNLTYENQIVYWANNNNNDSKLTIDIQAIMWPPIITYDECNRTDGISLVLQYQWCGPLMLIIKEFAKRINSK